VLAVDAVVDAYLPILKLGVAWEGDDARKETRGRAVDGSRDCGFEGEEIVWYVHGVVRVGWTRQLIAAVRNGSSVRANMVKRRCCGQDEERGCWIVGR